ncbi:MAG: hypothetical protein MUF18_05180 [Fimbriiglobus sp.]|nr:hypothetical protein [Fimbriiglobus sp.]
MTRIVAPERRWGEGRAGLPLRWVMTARREERPEVRPFNFSAHMAALCADVATRCPALAHIDSNALLYSFTPGKPGRTGLLARVSPLRFAGGMLYRRHRGRVYQVQRYFVNGREVLYVVAFCLPRFLDQPFDEKLVTVFHELYHISPAFNGDLRRFDGRCQFHTGSKKNYDAHMGQLVRAYLENHPRPEVFAFLYRTAAQLWAEHGGVYAVKVPRPKMVAVE